MLVVNVMDIIHTEDLTDPEASFCYQQDEELVTAVGAGLQDGDDLDIP